MLSESDSAEAFDRPILHRPHVVVRECPFRDVDIPAKQVQFDTHASQLLAINLSTRQGYMYDYDYFFPASAHQTDDEDHEALFRSVGVEMVDVVMHGRSANCVMLGMAHSGKTRTLFGTNTEQQEEPKEEQLGLLQRTVRELFDRLELERSMHSYEVVMRYWDVGRDCACDNLRSSIEKQNRMARDKVSSETNCATHSTSFEEATQRHSVIRDAFDRLEMGNVCEVSVRDYAEFIAVLKSGMAQRRHSEARRQARWHGFVQLAITTTDCATGEVCVLRNLTFVDTKGVERVGQGGFEQEEEMRQKCLTNVSLTLLFSGMIHSLEYRQRRMGHICTQQDLHQLIRKSQSFFMGCRFSQIMSQLVSGHEACVVVACVSSLSYRDTIECLESVQLMRSVRCVCVPIATSSQKGRLLRRLRIVGSKLTDPEVLTLTPEQVNCLSRPLTEEEERVLSLRGVIEGWDAHVRPPSGLDRLRSASASVNRGRVGRCMSTGVNGSSSSSSSSSNAIPQKSDSSCASCCVSEKDYTIIKATHNTLQARAKPSLRSRPCSTSRPLQQQPLPGASARTHTSGGVNHYVTHGLRRKIYLDANKTSTYEGQWANGLFDGFGEHITPTEKYRGEFRAGRRSGEGTWYTRAHTKEPYARVYQGEWLNNMRDGFGTEWCSPPPRESGAGEVYEGEFVANERHGQGTLYTHNARGDVVQGSFRRGRCEGWAVLRCGNGDWYEGEWVAGQRHGRGSWHDVKRERCMRGEWVADVFRLGTVEDEDEKKECSRTEDGDGWDGSGFIPRVGLCNWQAVLARERERLHERRGRETSTHADAIDKPVTTTTTTPVTTAAATSFAEADA